jgi:hypothetical protein
MSNRSIVFMNTTRILAVAVSLTLAVGGRAAAQSADPRAAVDVNIGGQTQSVTVASSSTFSLFGETGRTNVSQTVGRGLLFDAGAGYAVRKDFVVGVAVSVFSRAPAADVSIAVPDPIAFNSFSIVAQSPTLRQTEIGTHIRLAYRRPLTGRAAVDLFAGPSIVRLSKGVATATIVNGAPQITSATQAGTGFGANGGVDVTYRFMPGVGAGVFVRYVRAEVDLPAASGVKVGGFQGGLGLRLRF